MFAMKKLILAAFAIAAVVATSGNADAAFAIRIIHSSGTFTINNAQTFPASFIDIDPSATDILVAKNTTIPMGPNTSTPSFTIGNMKISGLTGGIGGSSASFGVTIEAKSSGAQTITFELSSTGYILPGSGPSQVNDSFSATVNKPKGATVSYQSWINSDNLLFSTTGVSVNGLNSSSPIPDGGSGPGLFTGSLPMTPATYSITTRTIFTFGQPTSSLGYSSATDVTNVVPAPAGLLLSLLGLPALAFARRFRRAVPVQA